MLLGTREQFPPPPFLVLQLVILKRLTYARDAGK